MKTGRPLKQIDNTDFEKLCGIQCTLPEIAAFFECDEDTINAWCKRTYGNTFSVVYKIYSGKGKISLRRTQFKLAEKNQTMAIWLGKQYLGQTDKIENTTEERIVVLNDIPESDE
jgi:hypothetical protein